MIYGLLSLINPEEEAFIDKVVVMRKGSYEFERVHAQESGSLDQLVFADENLAFSIQS